MKDNIEEIAIGAKVRITPQHWLRGYQEGFIVDFRPNGMNRWLVKFDVSYPGGGIDGDKLWFNESQFVEVKRASSAAGEMIGPIIQYRGLAPVTDGDTAGNRRINSADFYRDS